MTGSDKGVGRSDVKKGPSGRSYRSKAGLTRQPKKMRGRKVSSQRWLTRQLNDPFVAEAKSRGFRSRAALKLEQIDDRYRLFKPGMAIIDLGCAPGGWMQVASMRTRLGQGPARLIGIDLLETEVIVNANIFVGDMMDNAVLGQAREAVGGGADGVLSDMAAATTGHRPTDHLRTTALLEAALDFALEILNKDGFFLAKCFRGGAERSVLNVLQHNFKTVRHVKPAASRQESVESYVLATGFHGHGLRNDAENPTLDDEAAGTEKTVDESGFSPI